MYIVEEVYDDVLVKESFFNSKKEAHEYAKNLWLNGTDEYKIILKMGED